MGLATWWQGDLLPEIAHLSSFSARVTHDKILLSQLVGIPVSEVERRMETDNRPYIAYIGDEPTGYGWVADTEGVVIEAGLRFALPERDCYLWDFATLPAWRGHGVYPHLLQSIVRQELSQIDRFWILYAPNNHASESGIHKAGFRSVLDFVPGTHPEVPFLGRPVNDTSRGITGGQVLGIPLETLQHCTNSEH